MGAAAARAFALLASCLLGLGARDASALSTTPNPVDLVEFESGTWSWRRSRWSARPRARQPGA